MHRRTWQKRESQAARLFGSDRLPLSGSGSGHDRQDDSQHEALHIESKTSKGFAVWTLLDSCRAKARREGRTPLIALHRLRSPGFMLCIHSDDFDAVVQEYLKAKGNGEKESKGKKKRPPAAKRKKSLVRTIRQRT